MKTSIRKFLLVNLLLSLCITTLLTVIGNYFLGQKDIQAHVNSLNPQPVIPYTLMPESPGMDLKRHAASTHALGWQIIIDDLYIMLITFPLSGLLIWMIIGRGLDSISRVTVEVANRAPSHLEPVRLQDVPDEIRPLIEELNHLFTRLQHGFEREKRFAADAAHELKTPLAAIKAQAQVALNAPTLEEKNASLIKLLASVQRSTHIVQQLLMMSTLVSSDTRVADWEKVDLARVVREVLAMFVSIALERTVDLVLETGDKVLFVKGNATALAILFRNLIDNAIRYSPEGTTVRLCIFAEAEHVIVEIDDCGPGIPDELHERVFERFFRVLGNQSTGSGLGLAIVRQICQIHHAQIKFKKPSDRSGLIVQVSFPRVLEVS